MEAKDIPLQVFCDWEKFGDQTFAERFNAKAGQTLSAMNIAIYSTLLGISKVLF